MDVVMADDFNFQADYESINSAIDAHNEAVASDLATQQAIEAGIAGDIVWDEEGPTEFDVNGPTHDAWGDELDEWGNDYPGNESDDVGTEAGPDGSWGGDGGADPDGDYPGNEDGNTSSGNTSSGPSGASSPSGAASGTSSTDGTSDTGGASASSGAHTGGLLEGDTREIEIKALPGEFVIRKSAVNALGPKLLRLLNKASAEDGKRIRRALKHIL
jgi:hypothetical protein